MEHTEFLYHYTSIHNLALILKNKTFRFCNLLNVDDTDEAYTSDLGSAGKYALVSCWTATNEDVLPMWSMYTPNMSGVRIKMKKTPFKVYQYEPGELHFKEKVVSNINYYDENICKYAIAPSCPKLIKVEYTNDESLLYPKIRIENGENVKISFEKMIKYKREYWNFQNEYRYIITSAPWGIGELEKINDPIEMMKMGRRILDTSCDKYYNTIDLQLADNAFDGMEILLAPRTTEADYIIVNALLEKYCEGYKIPVRKSKIRIQ